MAENDNVVARLKHTQDTKKAVPKISLKAFTNDNSEEFGKDIFIPDWTNKPIYRPAILSLNGLSILSYQNLSSIIAHPGVGKSSIAEAIAANMLNPDADCLGFKIGEGCEGIISIDFERTEADVWNSFYRTCKRAGINYGDNVEGVKIAGMRSIPRLKTRLKAIEHLLQNNKCDILVLDGAGDMVTDTNDLEQAQECTILLRELTVKYNLSILTTLHPNPNSNKPRGHIGSEILRQCECVLLAKKAEGDYRIITSDFEYGKNRNNAPVTSAYKWCKESEMFITIDADNISINNKERKSELKIAKAAKLAKDIFPSFRSMTNSEFIAAIIQQSGVHESTAKRTLNFMLEHEIVFKKNGNYVLSDSEGSRFKEGSNGVQMNPNAEGSPPPYL